MFKEIVEGGEESRNEDHKKENGNVEKNRGPGCKQRGKQQ